MAAHGIDAHLRVTGINQFENAESFFANQIQGFLPQFVVGQAFAFDPDALVSRAVVAVQTLFLTDAAYVNGNNDENAPAVKGRLSLRSASDDSSIQLSARAESFLPQKRRKHRGIPCLQ